MPDAVTPTTPQCPRMSALRPWVAPRLAELPKLTALTLASAIGGGGGTGSGGSTVFGILLAIGLLFGAAACAPERESTVGPSEGGPEVSAQQLDCRADLAAHTLDCAPASGPQAGPGQTIFGQQGILVGLRSSNVTYDVGTNILSADVTVQNLSGGPIGTLDGVTQNTGIMVFFVSGPTASPAGQVTVANPYGLGFFTGPSQPFFLYDEMLAPGQVSGAVNWQFLFAGGATSFTFSVLLYTDVTSLGGMRLWSEEPGFGQPTLRGISGWGADGLIAFGRYGEHVVHENGVWRTAFDPLQGNLLSADAFATGPNDFWYFPSDGSINHLRQWDGSGWRSLNINPDSYLGWIIGLGVTGPGKAWGYGAGLWEFTGSGWIKDTLPTASANFEGFAAVGGKPLLVANGTFWLAHGHTYTRVGSASSGQNEATVIFATDTQHVWSTSNDAGETAMRYYDGTAWADQALPLDPAGGYQPVAGVALSPTNAWLVMNGSGGSEGALLHWNGTSWQVEFTNGATPLTSIWARSASEINITRGDGKIMRGDGAGGWDIPYTPEERFFQSAWMTSATQGFAVDQTSWIHRYDGATWYIIGSTTFGGQPTSVWASSATDLWVAGGQSSVDRFDGTNWTTATPGVFPRAIGGSGSSDVWAVGSSGGIAHWDGSAWTIPVNDCTITCLSWNSVWALDPNFAVAVGQSGKIARWNGVSWAGTTVGSSQFKSVSGTSATNVWAVGEGGTTARWNGTTWTTHTIPGGLTLNGVWAMSGGRAYAVTEEGSIWEWNGTVWSSMAATGRTEGQRLRAIHGAGNVAFIMGDRVFKGRR